MALEIRQSLKLTQSLIMTQKLQQAIKLLQLSRLELEGEIQQVLETNPVLEDSELQFDEKPAGEQELEVPVPSGDGEPAQEVAGENGEAKSSLKEWDWDSFLKDRLMPPPMGEYEEREAFPFESLNAEKSTLKSHLTWQLHMAGLDEEDEAIGTLIIGNLDLDGYLRATVEEIAGELSIDPARVEEILTVVQGFDPSGVAARSLKECLQIQ
ncbi:MAG TPA: RNA polymerase sigma-54 factor, partial [Desulfobaccales bacterium]